MPLWLVHSNVYSPKLKHFKVLKNLACRASTMSEIWMKNYQLFCNLQAFNFSVKFWRKTMRICVNRVTPLQNIHDSNLFFSFLRYRRFSLVFQSRDPNETKVSLSTHYLAAAKILFEFGCFALLCLGSENSVFISISSASAAAAAQLQKNIWLRRLPMYLS